MEGLAQANTVLTRYNSAVMAQLVQITEAMGAMKAQIKTLSSSATTRSPIGEGNLLPRRQYTKTRPITKNTWGSKNGC